MTRTFTFDEAQLHVPAEPGKPPMALWLFYSGKAEVDAAGNIVAIWIDQKRTSISRWPVPLGHELFRLLATSLRITHPDIIEELLDEMLAEPTPRTLTGQPLQAGNRYAVYVG